MKGVIIGGDERQFYLAKALRRFGYRIEGYHIECPQQEEMITSVTALPEYVDFWVLPIPFSVDGKTVRMPDCRNTLLLEEMVQAVQRGNYVFGGLFSVDFQTRLEAKEAICIDFMKDASVALKNAVATAEGAIAEAIIAGKGNLHRSRCLVMGYGRCAQVLAEKLKGLSARVCVSCRNAEALSLAEAMGYDVFRLSQDAVQFARYQYIFNTIPAPVLTERNLCECSRDTVIIDIASKPGGTDFLYCAKSGITAKLCGSLPGIYAPKASGEILAEAVYKVFETKNSEAVL